LAPDGFNGQLVKQSEQVRANYAVSIFVVLTQNKIPAFISKTRLIPLSKNRGLLRGRSMTFGS
jgi:hypothetical protein